MRTDKPSSIEFCYLSDKMKALRYTTFGNWPLRQWGGSVTMPSPSLSEPHPQTAHGEREVLPVLHTLFVAPSPFQNDGQGRKQKAKGRHLSEKVVHYVKTDAQSQCWRQTPTPKFKRTQHSAKAIKQVFPGHHWRSASNPPR